MMRKCFAHVMLPFSSSSSSHMNISLSPCHLSVYTKNYHLYTSKIFLLYFLLTFAVFLSSSVLIYLIETTKTSATSYIIFPFLNFFSWVFLVCDSFTLLISVCVLCYTWEVNVLLSQIYIHREKHDITETWGAFTQ